MIKRILRKCLNKAGYDVFKIYPKEQIQKSKLTLPYSTGYSRKIHYGCGPHLFEGWLNVDVAEEISVKSTYGSNVQYVKVDLREGHPFQNNFFKFGFAEDFIEHLDQAGWIFFLSECYRTFKFDGVLRLSFPGLENVLKRHYRSTDMDGILEGKHEAYTLWGHKHFCSKDELILLAEHIGFKKIEFREYGESGHPELRNLETRETQKHINTYAELTK